MKWTEEQQDAIDSKGSDLLVAAAAGSGKTAVLVERIIQKLLDETDPLHIDEILVATFTNAAAEEMRNRIGTALEAAIAKDPTSYHLKKQLALLQRASISTLHAFCTQVVRQYAYLLDIDPHFRIADEMEIALLKQEVMDELFEEAYGDETGRYAHFFQVVDMYASDRNDANVEKLILDVYTFAMQHPWPDQWLDEVAAQYDLPAEPSEEDLPWLAILRAEMTDLLTGWKEEIAKALAIAYEPDGPYEYVTALQADMALIDKALANIADWDSLQQLIETEKLMALSRKKMECNEDKKEAVKAIRSEFRDGWNQTKKTLFSRNLAGHIADMRALAPAVKQITALVRDYRARFTAMKKERALVDFTDLEHYCLAVLVAADETGETFEPTEVAAFFQAQFKEVLVDEYQDINIVQETILRAVSDQTGPGNMFMVGDVKQSIYRFRHAEPTLFIEKYNRFAKDPSSGKRIDLARNFRSREEVLTGANYIFKQVFDETIGEIAYDEKAALIYGNKSYDEAPFSSPETELLLIDLDDDTVAENDSAETEADLEKAQLEAHLYAKKIQTWIGTETGEPLQVVDKATGKQRDVQYRDIVILLRSLTSAPTIVDAFKKQGIPVYAELRTGYFEAIEIQVMLNMLKIIDNPYQDIPLASVLRSPIVHLDEEQLAQIRLYKKQDTFYEAVLAYGKAREAASERVAFFLQQLADFRQLAKEGALSDLIWEIFQRTGYYDFVGGIPGGRQRQANLRALYDRARGYESTSFRGLFRFLRFIENMQDQAKDLGEARALSEQEDVVRIMTIHKSKGLEFPVVILGGMNKQFNMQDLHQAYMLDKNEGFATKFIDPVQRISYPTLYYTALKTESLRQLLAEEMRVLYVALTRAKEKLVMIGTVPKWEKQREKWATQLAHEDWLLPKQLRKKAKTYLDWVAPAVIRHEMATVLRDNEEVLDQIPVSIRQDKSRWKIEVVAAASLTQVSEAKELAETSLKETLQAWQGVPDLDIDLEEAVAEKLAFVYPYETASLSRAKQSVTEIKRRQELADVYSDQRVTKPFRPPLVARPNFMKETSSLSAAEIGTAMHTVMQHLPIQRDYTPELLAEYIEKFVYDEKLTAAEAEVIDHEAILAFFNTDIARLMQESDKVAREVPFSYMLKATEVYPNWDGKIDEDVLIQGVIDCIIYTETGAIIVDYKTDHIVGDVNEAVITKLKDRYQVQVGLYEQALGDILQEKIRGTYLYFFAQNILIDMTDEQI